MSEPKICPIMAAGPIEINTNCKENRYAWYDREERVCAVLTIAFTLDNMDSEGITTREG